ncbi:MAG: hypothetical protein R3C49_12160 [Planctomycetaceae bacterium]
MVNEDELRGKRVLVGILCVVCLGGGLALLFFPGNEGLQAALLRVGLVLVAFWLCLPTKDRPAAWRVFSSNWTVIALIGGALIIPRAKALFPLLAALIGIALFARPRKR